MRGLRCLSVVLGEECVFSVPVLHFESVRVFLVVRVVPFLVLVFRMFLSTSAVHVLCMCCVSAVHRQFTGNSPIVHLQCVSFPTNASQIDTPRSSTRIFLIRNSCSQVVTKWCLLLLVFCRKVASAVVAVIIRSLSLFKSPTLSVSLPAMVK